MSHARTQHPNARLTPRHRRTMVGCVIDRGWTIEATAERFQIDAKTVRKWRDRFLAEGHEGLLDRSSRYHAATMMLVAIAVLSLVLALPTPPYRLVTDSAWVLTRYGAAPPGMAVINGSTETSTMMMV